ncbi:hypothetical protein LR69_00358 [Geobacillus sp. BCO2]|nr:hypothetical protein LR69_00358 [Geobacillus sp. BCO2]
MKLATIELNEEEKENGELMNWLSQLEEQGLVLEDNRVIYTGEDIKEKDIREKLTEGLEEAGLKKTTGKVIAKYGETSGTGGK